MKKVLVIDNNIDPPHGCADIVQNLQKQIAEVGNVDLFVRRGPESKIPDAVEGIDGVVISGSKTRILENAPWIDKQIKFISELHAAKIPTFGICFGEQLIARTLVGLDSVGPSKQYEFGWVEMKTHDAARESAIFKDLPKNFYSFCFHADEVYSLPEDRFKVLISSRDCIVQAYDVLDAPMWGIQFHPERSLEEGNKGLERLLQRDPSKEILGKDIGGRVYDSQIVAKLFKNFLVKVLEGRR